MFILKDMWVPEKDKVEDKNTIKDFITSIGLATLITNDTDFPVATHLPLELECDDCGSEFLRGHIANKNPQSEILKKQPNALVIFKSPIDHYISSSWYENQNAPTWNYMSVHLYGKISILTKEQTWHSVDRLTSRHEKSSKKPVSLRLLPSNIQRMLTEVTGFEIKIEKIEAAFKLSQSNNSKDTENIIKELDTIGSPISLLMSKILKKKEIKNNT